MPTKRAVTPNASPGPRDGAPYSPAIVAGDLVFVSGQLPVKADGELAGTDIATQTEQTMRNLEAVLQAAGSSLAALVKTTVFLTDQQHWAAMNDVYRRFVGDVAPARSAIETGRLAFGALVEIEAIALREN